MRWLAALLLCLIANAALAQNPTVPTRPPSDSSNAAASTAFVQNAIASVFALGAKCDGVTDDTTAINAAIAANVAVQFPSAVCKISAALVVPQGVTRDLRGNGQNASFILQTCNTCDGIQNLQTNPQTGGSIRGLSIMAGSATGQTGANSSGVGINLKNVNSGYVVDDVQVTNFATSYKDDGCFNLMLSNFNFLYFLSAGISVPVHSTGGAAASGSFHGPGVISNNGFTGSNAASIGISLAESGGHYFRNIDITSANNGVVVAPATSKQVAYAFFTDVLADTSTSDNWVFDGTNGNVVSIHCTQCWGAFSTNGSGLVTKGANLNDFRWTGGRLRENGQNGWHHSGGSNVYLESVSIAQNSKSANNTFDGVLIDASVSQWGLIGSRSGNYASGQATTQASGLNIGASANQFNVIGNNFQNPGSGKSQVVFGGTLGTSYQMLGNLPAAAGINLSANQVFSLVSDATVAQNTTVFFGPGVPNASDGTNEYILDRAGVISSFQMQTVAAPSAGQSFTYTIHQNGSDTAMTCSISGGASFGCSTLSNAVTVAAGDRISLKLVTSGTATATFHRGSMSVTP
jgi:hypothetical protein